MMNHPAPMPLRLRSALPFPALALLALVLLALVLLAGSGCTAGEEEELRGVASAEARTPVHVDSIFPIEEELRRFREGLEPAHALQGGESSREALVQTFLRGLEAGDNLAVAALAITPSEFAWLYYPHTRYTTPPYELSPAMVWFQLQNRSSRGLSRLLQRYAGKPLMDTGFQCPDEGEAFGEGWIWHGCTILGFVPADAPEWDGPHATPEGTPVEERLFGSILELGGRYKLVSFSNEL